MAESKMKVFNPNTDDEEVDIPQEEDDAGARLIQAGDRVFTLKRKDPYGMWEIKTKAGPIPQLLSGWFTSVHEAQRAIGLYLASKAREGIINRNYRKKLGLDGDTV